VRVPNVESLPRSIESEGLIVSLLIRRRPQSQIVRVVRVDTGQLQTQC